MFNLSFPKQLYDSVDMVSLIRIPKFSLALIYTLSLQLYILRIYCFLSINIIEKQVPLFSQSVIGQVLLQFGLVLECLFAQWTREQH